MASEAHPRSGPYPGLESAVSWPRRQRLGVRPAAVEPDRAVRRTELARYRRGKQLTAAASRISGRSALRAAARCSRHRLSHLHGVHYPCAQTESGWRRSRELPRVSEAKASSRNVLAEPSTASGERCDGVKRNAPIPLTHLVSSVLCQHRIAADVRTPMRPRRARRSDLDCPEAPGPGANDRKPDMICYVDGRRHTGREGPPPRLSRSVSSVDCRHRVARRQFDRSSSVTADRVGACGARSVFGLIGGG